MNFNLNTQLPLNSFLEQPTSNVAKREVFKANAKKALSNFASGLKGFMSSDVVGGLASGAMQLGYDALMRQHNEQREDTRYQRLAGDLQKAGFSKNIVSGATASANQAPVSDMSFLGDSLSKGLDRKLQVEQIALQRAKNNAEVANMRKTNQQLDAIIEGLNVDNMSKLEDLKHKRHINSLSELEREQLIETINKLKRDKDRLELEQERTKSYVEKQNIERDIRSIEKDIKKLDYNFMSTSGMPPIFWDKQGSSNVGLGAFVARGVVNKNNPYGLTLFENVNAQRKKDGLPPLTYEEFYGVK